MNTNANKKLSTAEAADFLLAQRQEVYGDRTDNMVRTAMMWSGFLGHEIKPWQVPIMMSLVKVQRLAVAPDYSDNIDDVDGWNTMFRELMGEDLIQARTVEEYLDKKHGPATRVPHEDEVKFPMTSVEIMQVTDDLREELGEYSPSGDEAFRDTLHDTQFPEDAPDTASSEGAAIDEFTTRKLKKEAEKSQYFHRYHKLNNETADDTDGPDDAS